MLVALMPGERDESNCESWQFPPHTERLPPQSSSMEHVVADFTPPAIVGALVVVDVQPVWWTHSERVCTQFPNLPRTLSGLLRRWRAAKMPVVHVRSMYTLSPHVALIERLNPSLAGGLSPNNSEAEPWAREMPGEPVVLKSCFDGFKDTGLQQVLSELGVSRVYMCGLITSACVLNTAFGAFHRGYEVAMVSNCLADRSKERHDATLALYDGYTFRVCIAAEDGLSEDWTPPPEQASLSVTGGVGSSTHSGSLYERCTPVRQCRSLSDLGATTSLQRMRVSSDISAWEDLGPTSSSLPRVIRGSSSARVLSPAPLRHLLRGASFTAPASEAEPVALRCRHTAFGSDCGSRCLCPQQTHSQPTRNRTNDNSIAWALPPILHKWTLAQSNRWCEVAAATMPRLDCSPNLVAVESHVLAPFPVSASKQSMSTQPLPPRQRTQLLRAKQKTHILPPAQVFAPPTGTQAKPVSLGLPSAAPKECESFSDASIGLFGSHREISPSSSIDLYLGEGVSALSGTSDSLASVSLVCATFKTAIRGSASTIDIPAASSAGTTTQNYAWELPPRALSCLPSASPPRNCVRCAMRHDPTLSG